MEVDNPCTVSTSSGSPTKHRSLLAGETDADENDNKPHSKRVKSCPEAELCKPVEEEKVSSNDEGNKDGSESNIQNSVTEKRLSQRLEVPSKEIQCIQKQVMIEKLMDTSPPGNEDEKMDVDSDNSTSQKKGRSSSKRQFKLPQNKERKTFKIESSLLAKVKSFLPEMKTANEELLKLPDPSKISLESDSDWDEMDGKGGEVKTSAPQPGTSASLKFEGDKQNDDKSAETVVEMNIAVVEETDSDTSSDGEDFVASAIGPKSSPNKVNQIGTIKNDGKQEISVSNETSTEDGDPKKTLITELN